MKIEVAFSLNGQVIGTAPGATRAEAVKAFIPTLRQLVLDGKVSRDELGGILAEDRIPLDYSEAKANFERQEEARRAKLAPKTLITLGGVALPIAADTIPYASENGRISPNAVLYREWYRTEDGGKMVITRDKGLNDAIVEWETL